MERFAELGGLDISERSFDAQQRIREITVELGVGQDILEELQQLVANGHGYDNIEDEISAIKTNITLLNAEYDEICKESKYTLSPTDFSK